MIEEWQEEISEEQEVLVWNDDEKIDSEFGFNTRDARWGDCGARKSQGTSCQRRFLLGTI